MKKGSSSNSSPKTFSSVFSARGTPLKEKTELFLFIWGYPLQKKQSWKSLEKGLGKNLSSERFFPVICISFYKSNDSTVGAGYQ